jgi:biopolymer transport protein ExbD
MTQRIVIPFLFLTLFVLGCKYFQPAQKLVSEAMTENPKRVRTDSELFLNGEPEGTISSIDSRDSSAIEVEEVSLGQTVERIIKDREANGVFLEGSNEIARGIYLYLDLDLSVGAFGRVYTALKNSGGLPQVVRRDFKSDLGEVGFRPYISYLEVSSGRIARSGGVLPAQDVAKKFIYRFDLEYVKGRGALLSTRAFQDSIEISADERLFANDKHTDDLGPKYTQVKQRQITTDVLKSELERIKASGNPITIIVSDKASYGKLLSVLETIDAEFLVLVRQSL